MGNHVRRGSLDKNAGLMRSTKLTNEKDKAVNK